MASTPPNLDFDHLPGFEIATKHKEAIRQLYWFAKVPKLQLQARYNLGESTIRRILMYKTPKRARPTRTGQPQKLTDRQVDDAIKYCAEKWENGCLDWQEVVTTLKLEFPAITLMYRMHQRGYYCCVACQKPYLTLAQVTARFL